jgi:molybdopterin converting factor small subunit
MAKVTIRYWAAAKEAAGLPEEPLEAVTLAEALNAAVASRSSGGTLRDILARSSVLVNSTRVNKNVAHDITLSDGAVIEILPPFAGG